jgi:hypothetical protein
MVGHTNCERETSVREVEWFVQIPFPIQSVTEVFGAVQYLWLVERNLGIEFLDWIPDSFMTFMGGDQSEDIWTAKLIVIS